MTISTTTIKNSYSGNGSTSVFNYTFKITDDDHIQVIIRSSTGTIDGLEFELPVPAPRRLLFLVLLF